MIQSAGYYPIAYDGWRRLETVLRLVFPDDAAVVPIDAVNIAVG
ncbi:MAG TPA: hypothetical protein VF899_15075 [Pyrinomonadaceae bacterium]